MQPSLLHRLPPLGYFEFPKKTKSSLSGRWLVFLSAESSSASD